MAQGDILLFDEWVREMGEEIHDWSSDTIKLGLIDNTTPPTQADATPRWADYVANEVGTGGGYPANGITLTSVTWTEAAGVGTLDAANVQLSQNASGFTDAYWGILYNDTAASDQAIGFVELGGPVSEVAGPVNINWNGSGILTITRS